MTSDRPSTKASGQTAATLPPEPAPTCGTNPHISDLKQEPQIFPTKQTAPSNSTSPQKRASKPSQQPNYDSKQRFREHPEQNTDIIPTSKQLEERWSPKEGADPVNNASILTFSSRKPSNHTSSRDHAPSHGLPVDHNVSDTSQSSHSSSRRRLNDGQIQISGPRPSSHIHPQSPPSNLSKSLRPSSMNSGLGASGSATRYHPYSNIGTHENAESQHRKRGRPSRIGDIHTSMPASTHIPILSGPPISPYSPRPESQGLTPLRQQFAGHSLVSNGSQQPLNSPMDEQYRQLPPLHQVISPVPLVRSHYDAHQNGFLIQRQAIKPDIVPGNVDIIGELAGAIGDSMPIEKRYKGYVTFCPRSFRLTLLRDAFINLALHALSPFYTPYNLPIQRFPSSQTLARFTGTTNPHHLDELLTWDRDRPTHIHVLVALTACNPKTGLFTLLSGSHGPRRWGETLMQDWREVRFSMNPGDALIWRGDMTYRLSGERMEKVEKGGKWALFSFPWVSEQMDLTA